MNVTIEKQGNINVVRPSGRLDFAASAGFQEHVDLAMGSAEARPAGVVIDATELEYVSSAGLRVFLKGAKSAQGASIAFVVCALAPTVREVFEVSGFDRIVTLKATLAEALAGIGG